MAELNVEHRPSDSVHVQRVWRSRGSDASRMLSVTNSNWELVVGCHGGRVQVTLRGPETHPSLVELPDDDGEAVGIVFAHGTAMPHLPVNRLVDTAVVTPDVSARRFALGVDEWEIPTWENAETFVGRLARAGVLRHDSLVADVAAGTDARGLTARSVQRRVLATTGLTRGTIRQIERARAAAVSLRSGTPTRRVVHDVGYYDQPHLARSLARFIGRTAGDLQRADPEEPLSLLYKTPGWDSF